MSDDVQVRNVVPAWHDHIPGGVRWCSIRSDWRNIPDIVAILSPRFYLTSSFIGLGIYYAGPVESALDINERAWADGTCNIGLPDC